MKKFKLRLPHKPTYRVNVLKRKPKMITYALVTLVAVLAPVFNAVPAAATVAACAPYFQTVVNNSGGRLEINTCVQHVVGSYRAYVYAYCYTSGGWAENSCNISWDWHAWVTGVGESQGTVGRSGLDNGTGWWGIPGQNIGCWNANIQAATMRIKVRFSPGGTLWDSGPYQSQYSEVLDGNSPLLRWPTIWQSLLLWLGERI